MSQDIGSLRQFHTELLGETNQPILKVSISSAEHESITVLTYLGTSIASIKRVEIFIIHINTVQVVLFNPRRESVRSGDRVGSNSSGNIRRSESRDNKFDTSCSILALNT
jgi:hypothetical protein